jgi:tetratricopeptide (TPR) repeat protein
MVVGKNDTKTLQYLAENPELVQYFKNSGPANYYWQLGNIYRYASKFDSAIYYFKRAEAISDSIKEPAMKVNISHGLADTYLEKGDHLEALKYFGSTFTLSKQMNRLTKLPEISRHLGMLYSKEGNFRQAYYYTLQADSLNNVLQQNTEKGKLVLLQVDQENKKP